MMGRQILLAAGTVLLVGVAGIWCLAEELRRFCEDMMSQDDGSETDTVGYGVDFEEKEVSPDE